MKAVRNVVTIASHTPVLAAALMAAPAGHVLELGSGAYSTALLHWLCRVANRGLLTLDSNADWVARMAGYQVPFAPGWQGHRVEHVAMPQDDKRLGEDWALALVDGCHSERAGCLARLHHVPIVVVHDTEPEHASQYPGMADQLAMFRFRLDARMPLMETNQTSVVSDRLDPTLLLRM